jgi:hypothetical protein
MNATGLSEAVHLGQRTPILDSVWAIPDSRLRFTSDMIFMVGRLGLPIWGALLSPLFNPLDFFPSYLIGMGILGASFLGMNSICIVKNSLNFIGIDTEQFNIKAILLTYATLILISPFISIFILEGTLTQLFFLVSISFLLSNFIKLLASNKKNDFQNISLEVVIVSIFIAICYPNGVILSGVLTLVFSIYYIVLRLNKKFPLMLCLAWITSLVVAYLILGRALWYVAISFFSGISGAPYNLGIFNLIDFFTWSTNAFQINPITIKGSGYYDLTRTSTPSHFISAAINFSILIAYLFIAILIFFKSKIKFFLIMSFFIGAISFTLVTLPLNPAKIHTYIYARNMANFLALGLPFLLAEILYLLFNRKRIKSQCIFLGSTVLLLTFSTGSFIYSTKNFKKFSEPFYLINSTNEFLKFKPRNSILVSDKPNHRIYSLAMFGPVFYLTDDWAPQFLPTNFDMPVNVIQVEYINGKLLLNQIGMLNFDAPLKGPINANEIKKYPGFTP